MDQKLIDSVANILEKWNPLGEQASSVSDLDGYHAEAIDIIASSHILKQSIKQSVGTVLGQAFGISLEEGQLNHYSKLIEQVINEH